jgi:hypothetical protein
MIHYQNTGISETNAFSHIYISNGNLYYDLPEENCLISMFATDGRLISSFSAENQTGVTTINVRNNQVVLIHIEGCETNIWNKLYYSN